MGDRYSPSNVPPSSPGPSKYKRQKSESESPVKDFQISQSPRYDVSTSDSQSSIEYIPESKKPRMPPNTNKSPVPSISSCMASQDFNVIIPPQVSKWKTIHLDSLSVFYAKNPVQDLDELFDKSSSYPTSIPRLGNDFTHLEEFLKEFLTFDVSHCKDMNDDEDVFKQDMSKIYKDTKKLEYLFLNDYLESEKVKKNSDLTRMFENVHVASVDFLNMMIEFMEEEFKDQEGCCYEFMYRTLYIYFFNVCCLKTRAGECYKKQLGIFSGGLIKSEPDLRCSLYKRLFFTSLKRTVLMIGEVKRRKGSTIDSENFSILRDLGVYDVLGQHGGELLVELSDSCFRKADSKLMFGAIGVGTQLIFTALEMKQETYQKITSSDDRVKKKQDETDFEKSYIYYTRPYDLLKASDRESLYGPLLRLACVQNQIRALQT